MFYCEVQTNAKSSASSGKLFNERVFEMVTVTMLERLVNEMRHRSHSQCTVDSGETLVCLTH